MDAAVGNGPPHPAVAASAPVERVDARAERVAWAALGALAALALFMLARPYRGIVHDSMIYLGRAMADLGPDPLGRDILFAHDGQSRFSLFPALLRMLVEAVGPSAAGGAVTALALGLWFGALGAFALRLGRGRLVWAILVCVALLPSQYGGFGMFHYAEPFATPRPLAEAAVIAGLAALLAGRSILALGLMGAAALVHPLMALPGLAVLFLERSARDLRWAIPPLAAFAVVLAACLVDAPVASRLAVPVDPAWSEALASQAYLFPSRWPAESWAFICVAAATVAVAAALTGGKVGRLLLAILAVAGLGILTSLVLGDALELLLVLQVQPWRALWLLGFAAAATLPIVVCRLWSGGGTERVALAALLFAWLSLSSPGMALSAAAVAVLLLTVSHRAPAAFGEIPVAAALGAVLAYALASWAGRTLFLAELWQDKAPGASLAAEVWSFGILSLPIVGWALVLAVRSDLRPPLVPAALAAATLAVAALVLGDDRSAAAKQLDQMAPEPALARLVPPGEVLWLGGPDTAFKAWSLLGRPNWSGYLQGAGRVFSRDLALIWSERTEALVAAQLASRRDVDPLGGGEATTLRPSERDLAGICAPPGGPAAILVPLDGRIILPDGIPAAIHQAAEPAGTLAIVDCLALPGTGRLRKTLP